MGFGTLAAAAAWDMVTLVRPAPMPSSTAEAPVAARLSVLECRMNMAGFQARIFARSRLSTLDIGRLTSFFGPTVKHHSAAFF